MVNNSKDIQKKVNIKSKRKKNANKKLSVLIGVIILGSILVYLMYYFFVEKNYIKINMPTDKQLERITLAGKDELIATQKYVSDLNYSMRYDIDSFKVFKYRNQDIFKYLKNDIILVVVEQSSLPKACSVSILETGYNSCYVKIDNYTEEYYISTNGKTYKITVKTPGSYEEGISKRISYMLNNFIISF